MSEVMKSFWWCARIGFQVWRCLRAVVFPKLSERTIALLYRRPGRRRLGDENVLKGIVEVWFEVKESLVVKVTGVMLVGALEVCAELRQSQLSWCVMKGKTNAEGQTLPKFHCSWIRFSWFFIRDGDGGVGRRSSIKPGIMKYLVTMMNSC